MTGKEVVNFKGLKALGIPYQSNPHLATDAQRKVSPML